MLKIVAIGFLGKDCVVNTLDSGKRVVNFTLAHTEKFKQGNELKEKTTWLSCAYWSDSKVSEYLKKGSQVYIEGVPEIRLYDKKDGSGQAADFKVTVFSVQLLGSKPADSTGPGAAAAPPDYAARKGADITEPIDDLPF